MVRTWPISNLGDHLSRTWPRSNLGAHLWRTWLSSNLGAHLWRTWWLSSELGAHLWRTWISSNLGADLWRTWPISDLRTFPWRTWPNSDLGALIWQKPSAVLQNSSRDYIKGNFKWFSVETVARMRFLFRLIIIWKVQYLSMSVLRLLIYFKIFRSCQYTT